MWRCSRSAPRRCGRCAAPPSRSRARRGPGCRAGAGEWPRFDPASFPVSRRATGRSTAVLTRARAATSCGPVRTSSPPSSPRELCSVVRPAVQRSIPPDVHRQPSRRLRTVVSGQPGAPRGPRCERDGAPPGRDAGGRAGAVPSRNLSAWTWLARHRGRPHRQLNPAASTGPVRHGHGRAPRGAWPHSIGGVADDLHSSATAPRWRRFSRVPPKRR